MEVLQIELTHHFTDKSAGTFVCKGDRFTAYLTEGADAFTVYDHKYVSHAIPFELATVVQDTTV